MKNIFFQLYSFLGMFTVASTAFAVDSYRYAHVTIDTPWNIFIFLLFIILTPFILMAVLYWYFANKKPDAKNSDEDSA